MVPPASPAPYSRLRWALVGALLAITLIGLVWLLASVIQSPQDALAAADAPPPSEITFPVERRAIDPTVRANAQLVDGDRVIGVLGVDERERAKGATRISVETGMDTISGKLQRIAPRGRFVVSLKHTLATEDGEVVVIFEQSQDDSPGLVVPISALFTSSHGGAAVVVVEDGRQSEVPVDIGDVVSGVAAITPVVAGTLAENDEVLVSEPSATR